MYDRINMRKLKDYLDGEFYVNAKEIEYIQNSPCHNGDHSIIGMSSGKMFCVYGNAESVFKSIFCETVVKNL